MASARAQRQNEAALGQTERRSKGSLLAGNGDAAARALGWFSVGLGLAEVAAPHSLGKAIGVRRPWTLRALGLRELASGVGILTRPKQPAWLWGRVAGDALDLALLGAALAAPAARRGRLAAAVGAVSLVTAADVLCSRQATQASAAERAAPLQFTTSIVIERSAQELYRFWRELDNLPRFMRDLREVRTLDERRSHWIAAGPAGTSIEWDAEITEDRADEMIAWRSLPDSPLTTAGEVHFERSPNGEGALVRLHVSYQAPGAASGAPVAKVLGAISKQQVKGELRRFKQLVETGELATIDGQPSGRRSPLVNWVDRAVQP